MRDDRDCHSRENIKSDTHKNLDKQSWRWLVDTSIHTWCETSVWHGPWGASVRYENESLVYSLDNVYRDRISHKHAQNGGREKTHKNVSAYKRFFIRHGCSALSTYNQLVLLKPFFFPHLHPSSRCFSVGLMCFVSFRQIFFFFLSTQPLSMPPKSVNDLNLPTPSPNYPLPTPQTLPLAYLKACLESLKPFNGK